MAEVDVGGCDVVDALVISWVVVVFDEGFDLSFEVTWQQVAFQQNAVLQGLMPSFDLALGSRMIRRTARMFYAFILQPICQTP